MKTIFSMGQLAHNPTHEISDGALQPAVEIPARAEMVRKLRKLHDAGLINMQWMK